MKTRQLACAATVLLCASNLSLKSQLVEIGPFAGATSETWESFTADIHMASPISIMGGSATASGPLLYVYRDGTVSSGDGFFGVSEGTKGIQVSGLTLAFTDPVRQFGAYWSCYVLRPSMHVEFFDAGDGLIGTADFARGSGGALVWQGWESSTPIKRVVLAGGIGVEAMDGLQATVPEPASMALLAGLGLVAFTACRRRRASPTR